MTTEQRQIQYPSHSAPRVWFITDGSSPIGISVTRNLLDHGDSVCVGVSPTDWNDETGERPAELLALMEEVYGDEQRRCRIKIIKFDIRRIPECQTAVAEAVQFFGHVDILLCDTIEVLVGTVEELAKSFQSQYAVHSQFEANFFGPVHVMKTLLPHMRQRRVGHIVLLTGITAHLGTPGLPAYCASHWALEGYCDSLAYEIAPFNIRVSIVQSSFEVAVLTNRITAVASLPQYTKPSNDAPLAREKIARLIDAVETPVMRARTNKYGPCPSPETTPSSFIREGGQIIRNPATATTRLAPPTAPGHSESTGQGADVASLIPRLPASTQQQLIKETVYALLAIGGHENPPARHIVGHEGVASVKEKLRTVSEELEEFVSVSGPGGVDYEVSSPVAEMRSEVRASIGSSAHGKR